LAAAWHMAQTTIYVNYTSGNDATGTGSSGSPYKTFTKGYTVAASGDILDLTGTFDWTNTDETGENEYGEGYDLTKNITIQGQGADQTIIQAASSIGDENGRIFTIYEFQGVSNVTIKNLTLRYGVAPDGYSSPGGAIDIYGDENNVSVTIQNCYIHDNKTYYTDEYNVDGFGGAIEVYDATLIIENSTLANNICRGEGGGGAIHMAGSGDEYATLEITNSTICNNESPTDGIGGGGILIDDECTVTITNSTISNNNSNNTDGGGIYFEGGLISIKNTILANNTGNSTNNDYYYGVGTLTDNGYNIVEYSDVAAHKYPLQY